MNEHLNIVEWRGLLLHDMEISKRARALRHIAECPICGKLHEAAISLRGKLIGMRAPISRDSPYLAVAGPDHSAREDDIGGVSVRIVSDKSGPRFDPYSLQAYGIGEKYALNFEDDMRTLTDDEGLICIKLAERIADIDYADSCTAFARLGGDVSEWTMLGIATVLPLPDDTGIRFELLLF